MNLTNKIIVLSLAPWCRSNRNEGLFAAFSDPRSPRAMVGRTSGEEQRRQAEIKVAGPKVSHSVIFPCGKDVYFCLD